MTAHAALVRENTHKWVPETGTSYLGVYVYGVKFGSYKQTTSPARFHGIQVQKTTSTGKITLGQEALEDSEINLIREDGTPLAESRVTREAKGVTRDSVEFGSDWAIYRKTFKGHRTVKRVPIPKGQRLIVDFLAKLSFKNVVVGSQRTGYAFDMDSAEFQKNVLTFKGKATTSFGDKIGKANWIHVDEPELDYDAYCDDRGVTLKLWHGDQLELLKESAKQALAWRPDSTKLNLGAPHVDGLNNPDHLKEMKLGIDAKVMDSPPSDDHQTATKTPTGWELDVHPISGRDSVACTISEADKAQPKWLGADKKILSDSPKFKALAHKIVGNETDVFRAAQKIQAYVADWMHYDASLEQADLRNAGVIYHSRRGVCLDYAVLATTLMRAAGIPTKLVTGLCSRDGDHGQYGYHAWVLVFTGNHWIGLEPQSHDPGLSPGYIELLEGSTDKATDIVGWELHLSQSKLKLLPAKP